MANGAPPGNHPFFGASGIDPANPPDATVVLGYHANIDTGMVRIFLTLDCSEWLDVSSEDIVAHVAGGADKDATAFWISRTASLARGSHSKSSSDFLSGSLLYKSKHYCWCPSQRSCSHG